MLHIFPCFFSSILLHLSPFLFWDPSTWTTSIAVCEPQLRLVPRWDAPLDTEKAEPGPGNFSNSSATDASFWFSQWEAAAPVRWASLVISLSTFRGALFTLVPSLQGVLTSPSHCSSLAGPMLPFIFLNLTGLWHLHLLTRTNKFILPSDPQWNAYIYPEIQNTSSHKASWTLSICQVFVSVVEFVLH